MYMSNHPDTLVAYVKHWGKVAENVASAKMTSIDTKVSALLVVCVRNSLDVTLVQGMTLTYKAKAGGAEKEVRVRFDPPLLGYEEVKPRLISMKVDAEEALGMVRARHLRPQSSLNAISPPHRHALRRSPPSESHFPYG